MPDFDQAALARWMEDAVPGFAGLQSVEKFADGQSNPTYRIVAASGDLVLRRKPFGPILPSAHAVDREYRLLAALHPTGFPVARPIALCEEEGVIGAPFYVMEMVEGRTFWEGTLPGLQKGDRRACYEAMIDTLAALHGMDHRSLGLETFGAPGNYIERQIQRWIKQYRASQTDDIPEMDRLIEWLPRTAPTQTGTSIIHGDYRIDNLIFAPEDNVVRAVLDWELATIGDPLADFAYFAMNWILPPGNRAGLAGIDFDQTGLPSLAEATERYCASTGRDSVPDLHWHFSYNLFRLAGIVQGIKKRMLDGNASSAHASGTVGQIVPLAKAAWAQAREAGAIK